MTEEQIVKKLCEILDVKYSHYDNHKMTTDYFSNTGKPLASIPKIVAYSGMSPWKFAILEDMTVITPMSGFHKTILSMEAFYKEHKFEFDDEKKKLVADIKVEAAKIKGAEKYLKDNNCALVINDKTKEINWV